jgi:hypothetical protein
MVTESQLVLTLEMMRPSVLFRPRLFMEGNRWTALYGQDHLNGVAGFGKTPDQAMRDFDRRWYDEVKAGRSDHITFTYDGPVGEPSEGSVVPFPSY